MYFKRFQQGDMVNYCGEKFGKELHGKLGYVHARVQGSDAEVVVDFGSDSFIMDENRDITRFQGKPKAEHGEKDERKGPEVQKRRTKRVKPGDEE